MAGAVIGNETGDACSASQRRHDRDVGETGLLTLAVGAADQIVDVVHEQRAGADDGEVVLARRDDRVAGLVGRELGVVEVDDDLAPREAAVLVDVLPQAR